MRFSMLYSGEQILSFKSCLVFYAGDSLNWLEAGYLGQRLEGVCSEDEGHIIYKRHSNAV